MEILQAFKSANQDYIFITNSLESLTYTIIINNISTNLASDVAITDIIPYGACFQEGSFTLNGSILEDADPNDGVNIGNIGPNGHAIVTFDVNIDPNCPPSELQNYAVISFINCSDSYDFNTITTNIVKTPIISVCVNILKSVNKCFAKLNDTLNYTLIIKNNSTVSLENVVLYDAIPDELTVLPNSVLLNGNKIRYTGFEQGLNLGTIKASSIIIVLFQAIIDCLPCSTEIKNQAYIEYDYTFTIDDFTLTSSGNSYSNFVSTQAGPESFKQLSLDQTLNFPCDEYKQIEIVDKFLDIAISRKELIDTIRGTSCEGEILTGRKLLIDGTLIERIEYIELCSQQSINVAEYNIPFSTFIVLSENCNLYDDITIESVVENFDIKIVNNESLYQNVVFLLKVNY